MKIFKDLYNYRELLKTNITKDIGGKYKHSFLGILWSFVNPLLQIFVYAFVFQVILKSNIENYAVYLCCGLVPWQYFSSVVLRGAAIMVDNGNIIKKVYFPREILPISLVTSEGVNFLISTIIILGFVIFGGIGLSFNILWYFVIVAIQFVVSIGVAFIVSSLTVYFRDLLHILGILMQLLFDKKNAAFFFIGWAMTALFSVNTVGAAVVGTAIAYTIYQYTISNKNHNNSVDMISDDLGGEL